MLRRLSGFAVLLAVTAGCASGGGRRVDLVVYGAASLRDPISHLADEYMALHHVRIETTFGASSTLAQQVKAGAAVDLLATADEQTMVAAIGAAGDELARTHLSIAVAKGNPKQVRSLADLTRPDVRVALGAEGVPVATYAQQVLAKAGLTVTPAVRAVDAKALMAAVSDGGADAAIGYATDAIAPASRVDEVKIPSDQNVVVVYRIAVVPGAKHAALAGEFAAYLQSAPAQDLFSFHGFDAR